MFNIGGGELIVIMLIALIVLGPKRLPDAARQVGKAMSELRRMSTSFQNEVRTALDTADDPDRIAARRNVLAKEAPSADPSAPARPVRTEPLVAGPGLPPRASDDATGPAAATRPSAQARAAAKKSASAKAPATTKKARAPRAGAAATPPAKNGTPVKKAATTKRSPSTKRSSAPRAEG